MADLSIGALWKKSGSQGDFLSGEIQHNGEKIPIVIFKNRYKTADKQPDYKIFQSKPREQTRTEDVDDEPF